MTLLIASHELNYLEHDSVVAPPNVGIADDRPDVSSVAVAVVTEGGDLLRVGEGRREVVRVEVTRRRQVLQPDLLTALWNEQNFIPQSLPMIRVLFVVLAQLI